MYIQIAYAYYLQVTRNKNDECEKEGAVFACDGGC